MGADLEIDFGHGQAIPRMDFNSRHFPGFKARSLYTNRVGGRLHGKKVEESLAIAGRVPGRLARFIDQRHLGAGNKCVGRIANRAGDRCGAFCAQAVETSSNIAMQRMEHQIRFCVRDCANPMREVGSLTSTSMPQI